MVLLKMSVSHFVYPLSRMNLRKFPLMNLVWPFSLRRLGWGSSCRGVPGASHQAWISLSTASWLGTMAGCTKVLAGMSKVCTPRATTIFPWASPSLAPAKVMVTPAVLLHRVSYFFVSHCLFTFLTPSPAVFLLDLPMGSGVQGGVSKPTCRETSE